MGELGGEARGEDDAGTDEGAGRGARDRGGRCGGLQPARERVRCVLAGVRLPLPPSWLDATVYGVP